LADHSFGSMNTGQGSCEICEEDEGSDFGLLIIALRAYTQVRVAASLVRICEDDWGRDFGWLIKALGA
jgi:hypothetical protein